MKVNDWRSWLLDPKIILIAGILLGIGLGLIGGWLIWPVTYYDTDPYDLRADYRDDFVVMVGALYAIDQDIDRARQLLAAVAPPDSPRPVEATVVDVTERYIARSANRDDIDHLVGLARALGSVTTPMQPYLDDLGS
jgi:hypothetical protein